MMTWVFLDDKFHSNPKTVGVGNDGAGLYCRALSYCGDQLTDGYVPMGWAREVGKPGTRNKVTCAGFWLEVFGGEQYHYVADDLPYTVTIPGPGFFIPDYLMLNPTRAQVEKKRTELSAKRSTAGKLGAQSRWHGKPDGNHDGNEHGKAMANVVASEWQPDGPHPQPLPLTSPRAVTALRPAALGESGNGPGEISIDHVLKDIA
jgi:hypothetical protein